LVEPTTSKLGIETHLLGQTLIVVIELETKVYARMNNLRYPDFLIMEERKVLLLPVKGGKSLREEIPT
jgi:hypothetical protein